MKRWRKAKEVLRRFPYHIGFRDTDTQKSIDWRAVDLAPGLISSGPQYWGRRDYAELAGAHVGSQVSVNFLPEVLVFSVDHEMFAAPFRFAAVFDNGYHAPIDVIIQYIELKPEWQAQGKLTRIFAVLAQAAARLGFGRIVVETALKGTAGFGAGKNFNGHYTWVRLGLNAPLPHVWRDDQPFPFSSCEMATEVLVTERGRRHWLERGIALQLTFDLKRSSDSWQTLWGYLRDKRIRVSPCTMTTVLRQMKKLLWRSGGSAMDPKPR